MPLSRQNRDPLAACVLIAAAFLALLLWRLGIPHRYYFDEVHYVPASLKLLQLIPANREHPMLGKEVIAASIRLLGDRPFAWRIGSVLFGALGLFAFGRLVWHLSQRRRATLLAMVLLATDFTWFIQSRIAMLDMVCAGCCMVGLWQFAAALRCRRTGPARAHLIASGVALGLSLGAKWTSAPALMLPGLAFLALRIHETGPLFLGKRGAGPVKGVPLAEAALWLGLLPLAVYWATYIPGMFYATKTIAPLGFVHQHELMIQLQDSVRKPHPYRTVWYEWVADWRGIWYLFDKVDGAWRGIVLIGNPLTMLAGLGAYLWALWATIMRRRWDAGFFVALYVPSVAMWAFNGKPVQFYYHYLLPAAWLMALLALALDVLWDRKDRWQQLGPGIAIVAVALFIGFFPILSGMALPYKSSYAWWMWLPSWR